MSFSTNGVVTLTDAQSASKEYHETSNTGAACVYRDRTQEIGTPRTLTISHQDVGKSDKARQRTMQKTADTIENPVLEGDCEEVRIHTVVDFPKRIVTKAQIIDLLTRHLSLLSAVDFVDKAVNKEV